MNIHEYQARDLLAKFGIPVPPGIVVASADEAGKAFDKLKAEGASLTVVKAQVHAGGRGKGGGVKLAKTTEEAKTHAGNILSKQLITPQTGPQGVKVHKLLVASGVDIAKEYYLAIAIDRAKGCPVLIASSQGGMDIEEVAHSHPDAIVREPISAIEGLKPYQAAKVAYAIGFTGSHVKAAAKIMTQLADLFIKSDASLAEINPLVVTKPTADAPEGKVVAIDAKITFDENGLFRHPEIAALADPHETDASEARAQKFGLSYIKLDGDIGCLVNGAGLAMATMDIVKLHGGEPANFLDVGGSASQEAVTEAFRIILSDPNVKGVMVNIFGGIAKCDTIAKAIIAAATEVGFKVPLVVRLEGTNVEVARKLLQEQKANIPMMQVGTDITDAAKKITAAVYGKK